MPATTSASTISRRLRHSLSTAGARRVRSLALPLAGALFLAALFALRASPAGAVITFGAMGDSYTDEYSQFGDPNFRNWVDTLVASGRADFGTLLSFPASDPRNPGIPTSDKSYSYNYAHGGATTSGTTFRGTGAPHYLNSQFGSPTQQNVWGGIRKLGLDGTIEYANMFIGGNDILGNINNGYNFKNGVNTAGLNTILGRFTTALDIATANGTSPLKITIPTMPDLGSMPYMTNGLAGVILTPAQQANVRANVQLWNESITSLAATRGIAVVDWWGVWEDVRLNSPTVHGMPVTTNNFFLADGVHPAPIGQALFANKVVDAVRNFYGEADIAILSSKELVTYSGLDPQQAPVASAGAGYAITTYDGLTLDATGTTDANPGDLPYLTFSWDINGDGVYGDATGAQPALQWSQLVDLGIGISGTYQVSVRVDDSFGGITTSTPVTLAVAPLTGDVNADGIVNGQDITLVASHWLQLGEEIPGDANSDGIVNGQDIAEIAAHWLNGANQEARAATVPEPTGVTLLVVGSLFLGCQFGRARTMRKDRLG